MQEFLKKDEAFVKKNWATMLGIGSALKVVASMSRHVLSLEWNLTSFSFKIQLINHIFSDGNWGSKLNRIIKRIFYSCVSCQTLIKENPRK